MTIGIPKEATVCFESNGSFESESRRWKSLSSSLVCLRHAGARLPACTWPGQRRCGAWLHHRPGNRFVSVAMGGVPGVNRRRGMSRWLSIRWNPYRRFVISVCRFRSRILPNGECLK